MNLEVELKNRIIETRKFNEVIVLVSLALSFGIFLWFQYSDFSIPFFWSGLFFVLSLVLAPFAYDLVKKKGVAKCPRCHIMVDNEWQMSKPMPNKCSNCGLKVG
ncbi:MAG: hypothetical protein ACI9T7_001883 [Oleiphilaceae bacterium]|jgi:hypothetical protein